MLAHEANHAKRYDETQSDVAAKASFENDTRRGSDPEYGTLEERRVIEGTEGEECNLDLDIWINAGNDFGSHF